MGTTKELRYLTPLLIALALGPGRGIAGDGDAAGRCAPRLPEPTRAELIEAGFHPGGLRPFLLAIFGGPRIALEWNDGRGVRPIELLRAVPYLGNLVGLYLCTEALSGYRMTTVAAETGIDDWRRVIYFRHIGKLESEGHFTEAAHLRECSPFDTHHRPPDPAAIKPPEHAGFAKWKSGLSGLLIDNRVGLEREESRGIRGIEYWTILRLPVIIPAIAAFRGRSMSDVAAEEHLDEAWLSHDSAPEQPSAEVGAARREALR